MTTDLLILQALRNSTLTEELRDAEIDALAKIIVVRGIIRHVHGIVRRMNLQSVEMSNYIYKLGGKY